MRLGANLTLRHSGERSCRRVLSDERFEGRVSVRPRLRDVFVDVRECATALRLALGSRERTLDIPEIQRANLSVGRWPVGLVVLGALAGVVLIPLAESERPALEAWLTSDPS